MIIKQIDDSNASEWNFLNARTGFYFCVASFTEHDLSDEIHQAFQVITGALDNAQAADWVNPAPPANSWAE